MKTLHHSKAFIILCACFSLMACHEKEEEITDTLKPYVVEEAAPILKAEGSLSVFRFIEMDEDPTDVKKDIMSLRFDVFKPSQTNVEPDEDEDEDPTLNDLKFMFNIWQETVTAATRIWEDIGDGTTYPSREYQVLKKGKLSAPIVSTNHSIFETIDDNIYERYLGTTFVWDLGDLKNPDGTKLIEATYEVAGNAISAYESFSLFNNTTYNLVPFAAKWAEDVDFSDGAILYGGSRSIAEDSIVIEAVKDGETTEGEDIFSFSQVRFGNNTDSIEEALEEFPPAGKRMKYRFSTHSNSSKIVYIDFSTSSDEANFYLTPSAGEIELTVSYSIDTENSILEIDMTAINYEKLSTSRESLGIPAYINPVIVGPFTEDGSETNDISLKYYFYGKRYIKTNIDNRKDVDPIFFLNAKAENDIKKTFKAWRELRHLDGP